MIGASVVQPGHLTARHHHGPILSVVDLNPFTPFELRDHAHTGPASAVAEETAPALGEATRQALARLREEMEEIEPMQDPCHQVGTSGWEAQLTMPGDEHEYTSAPRAGGGESMPSAVQPYRPIVVSEEQAVPASVRAEETTPQSTRRLMFHLPLPRTFSTPPNPPRKRCSLA